MISAFLQALFYMLGLFIQEVMRLLYEVAEELLTPVFEAMLPGHNVWGTLSQFYNVIDMWLDVDLILFAIVSFHVYWGALILYRIVKSWIPSVSG